MALPPSVSCAWRCRDAVGGTLLFGSLSTQRLLGREAPNPSFLPPRNQPFFSIASLCVRATKSATESASARCWHQGSAASHT